jgi:uncharacterized membrane protein YeaQ/YmgE (transglycosylase-associated protein family)
MKAEDIMYVILAGGLLGLLGQGIRMAIGFKKLADVNTQKPEENKEEVSPSRLLISLFIGFIAGALFHLVNDGDFSKREYIFTVIAAGYAGADFIEGLFNTYIKKSVPATDTRNASKTDDEALVVKEEEDNQKTLG